MSLQTDKIFYKALTSCEEIRHAVDGRIYNTAIPLPDEDLDNVPPPYIIVTFDGMSNDASTKDDYEGYSDTVQIGVEIVAEKRGQLAELAELARTTIREFFQNATDEDEDEDFGLVPLDYSFSASGVSYDSLKPCYWQALTYSCDTNI